MPRTEAGFLVPEEAARLLEAIRGSEFELPILVGLYGGLRPSEYLALRWADLDEANGELRVTQTVRRVRNDRVTRWNGVEVEGFAFGAHQDAPLHAAPSRSRRSWWRRCWHGSRCRRRCGSSAARRGSTWT